MADAAVLSAFVAILERLSLECPSCPRWFSDDAVPSGTALPYGVIASPAEEDESFLGHAGAGVRMVLRWFTDDREDVAGVVRGAAPALDIWSEIKAALHKESFSLTDHALIQCRVELIDVRRDSDGYRNGIANLYCRTLTA